MKIILDKYWEDCLLIDLYWNKEEKKKVKLKGFKKKYKNIGELWIIVKKNW